MNSPDSSEMLFIFNGCEQIFITISHFILKVWITTNDSNLLLGSTNIWASLLADPRNSKDIEALGFKRQALVSESFYSDQWITSAFFKHAVMHHPAMQRVVSTGSSHERVVQMLGRLAHCRQYYSHESRSPFSESSLFIPGLDYSELRMTPTSNIYLEWFTLYIQHDK